ncbi:MAG: C25 family cysteine peptidase [Candidatus Cloacimonetes bacterium]|nr:C25 family cysteine peptidase [Candidatus Cloacimonadota bacterium]
MKYTLCLILMVVIATLTATPQEMVTTSSRQVHVKIEALRTAPISITADDYEEYGTTTAISRTYAMPYQDAELRIVSQIWNVYDQNGNFLYQHNQRADETLGVVNSFNFREMMGHTILIETQRQINGQIHTLADVEYTVDYSHPLPIPNTVSEAFIGAYQRLASNYETSYLRDIPIAKPSMLIISHSSLDSYLTEFLKWKRMKGFDIYVVNKSDIGNSVSEIKSFISDHYEQYKCDYLLLLGDVSGNFAIPTNFFPSPDNSENDADDNHYTMLVGTDYFPEILVGRFSFGDISEFVTMTNKTISYEKAPFMQDTAWMRKALFAAGNYAEGTLRPITPVQMSRSTREIFLDYGYTQVDTVFYPPTYPGTTLIQSSITQGVQIVSYRGWGDANGWHYPYFHIPELNNTFNGPRMPIVYSIVCNTGDFANTVNPNFGEKWMRMGTMAQPGGCVAFVGPSDLHTKTRYNNSISTGMYRSFIDFGERIFSTTVLEGKIEMYKNFPNELASNQHVAFYFHVYNSLCDPSLNMWVLVPNTIVPATVTNEATFAQSDSHIRIANNDINGAIVTGTKDFENFTYAVVQDGVAILPVNPEQQGELTITVSRKNYVPLVKTLTPSTPAGLGIVGNSLDGVLLQPNSDMEVNLTVKNYGETAISNLDLVLRVDNEYIAISNANQNIASLAPGGTQELTFPLSIGSGVLPRHIITFTLAQLPDGPQSLFQVYGGGAEFAVLSTSGTLALGENSPVSFVIRNIGSQDMMNAQLTIHSLNSAAEVTNSQVDIGAFPMGADKTINSSIQIAQDTYNGRNIPLKFTVSDDDNYSIDCYFAVTAGTPGTTDPTGPCTYGYFAYDNFDATYEQSPTYEWIEIDPLLGGEAEVFLNMDDGSRTIDLPFTFRFYGQDYNQITICSNGWMSFGQTWMADFYNHYIPAALGPKAMVAGYWDDLKGRKTGVDNQGNGIFNDIRMLYWHDSANNRYIVQWNEAYNQYTIEMMQDASLEKFQIILYPHEDRDGDIVIQYHTVDNPGVTTNYCTVGIEDHTQTDGLTYTHANFYPATATPLQAGLAVKYTTTAPDSYVSSSDVVQTVPFQLHQNYPNPFNPSTSIAFDLKHSGRTSLKLYNLKGQLVRTLLDANASAGTHRIVWDGKDDKGMNASSGIYFYRLTSNGKSESRKMLLMK